MNSRCLLGLVFILNGVASAFAADEPADDSADIQAWRATYRQVADQWEIVTNTNPARPLVLHPESLLSWTSLDDFNGDVFLWTADGSPQLLGSVFSFARGTTPPARQVISEFHSLSSEPLKLTHTEWGTVRFDKPLTRKPLPSVPRPHPNPRLRTSQMRNLARQFSAHMEHGEERWELRLLPQPLYVSTEALADGEVAGFGLFAFVGFLTDPEILLLLEARRSEDGLKWYYQPMRFSNRSLWLKYNNQEIWKSLVDVPPEQRHPDDFLHKILRARRMTPEDKVKQ